MIEIGQTRDGLPTPTRASLERVYFQSYVLRNRLNDWARDFMAAHHRRVPSDDEAARAQDIIVTAIVQELIGPANSVELIAEYSRALVTDVGDVITVLYQWGPSPADSLGPEPKAEIIQQREINRRLGKFSRGSANTGKFSRARARRRSRSACVARPLTAEELLRAELRNAEALKELADASPSMKKLIDRVEQTTGVPKKKKLKIEEPPPRDVRDDLWGEDE